MRLRHALALGDPRDVSVSGVMTSTRQDRTCCPAKPFRRCKAGSICRPLFTAHQARVAVDMLGDCRPQPVRQSTDLVDPRPTGASRTKSGTCPESFCLAVRVTGGPANVVVSVRPVPRLNVISGMAGRGVY